MGSKEKNNRNGRYHTTVTTTTTTTTTVTTNSNSSSSRRKESLKFFCLRVSAARQGLNVRAQAHTSHDDSHKTRSQTHQNDFLVWKHQRHVSVLREGDTQGVRGGGVEVTVAWTNKKKKTYHICTNVCGSSRRAKQQQNIKERKKGRRGKGTTDTHCRSSGGRCVGHSLLLVKDAQPSLPVHTVPSQQPSYV